MAKRATPRAQAEDTAGATPPRPRRQRAANGGQTAPAAELHSTSMGSEPSEEDIRMRAYHRYLERGGGHGMDFEDWLEAEREIKSKQKS
jgi:hypothetical protein